LKPEAIRLIVDGLKEAGVNFVTLMADADFVDAQQAIRNDPAFKCVSVSSEATGAAVCAGAWLGGKVPALLCPTSGLMVAAWPLTSIGLAWGIPIMLVIPYRGDVGDGYWVMRPYYYTTKPTLRVLQIPYLVASKNQEIKGAIRSLRKSAAGWMHPVALLLAGETMQ
jgi:sulfopyruvate decarboxylase subunit alpha